jgi:competence protein ComEA
VSPRLRTLLAVALLALATPALAAKKPLAASDRIDLNRAGVTELMRLPGVGERRARAIVEQRSRAPFRRLEDVLQVKGLGPKWLAKVRAHVVVGGAPAPAVPARKK